MTDSKTVSFGQIDNSRPNLHNASAVEQFRRRHRIDPDRIRRMRHALYRQLEPFDQAIRRLGPVHSADIRDEFQFDFLQLLERYDSQLDGSTKLVFKTQDGRKLETVLIRAATGRTTVCVSSQVGCAAGCPFCATARMGLHRSLIAAEIVEQVLRAGQIAKIDGRRIRNVVFMGMGEPLDNEEQLHATLQMLQSPVFFDLTPRRLMVSTVGIPDAMRRLVDAFPGVHMALSLHSARPELRAKLIPWSHRHTWEELRDTLRYVASKHSTHRHQGPVMIEHIMIDDVNDSQSDAEALVDYLDGIPAHVNLIPYNAVPHAPGWNTSPRAKRDAFASVLRDAGIFTTIRYSMGEDVNAACGQLAQS